MTASSIEKKKIALTGSNGLWKATLPAIYGYGRITIYRFGNGKFEATNEDGAVIAEGFALGPIVSLLASLVD